MWFGFNQRADPCDQVPWTIGVVDHVVRTAVAGKIYVRTAQQRHGLAGVDLLQFLAELNGVTVERFDNDKYQVVMPRSENLPRMPERRHGSYEEVARLKNRLAVLMRLTIDEKDTVRSPVRHGAPLNGYQRVTQVKTAVHGGNQSRSPAGLHQPGSVINTRT
jgi:hypothetical protein